MTPQRARGLSVLVVGVIVLWYATHTIIAYWDSNTIRDDSDSKYRAAVRDGDEGVARLCAVATHSMQGPSVTHIELETWKRDKDLACEMYPQQMASDPFYKQGRFAKGEVSIEDLKPAPTLREFAQTFIDFVQTRHANKPETVKFYSNRLKRLLEWETLRETRLDRIDEALIAKYIGVRRKDVGIVAVNRELATLRRALHVAHEWKVIRSVPKVRLLPGEQSRDFVLDHETERRYLEACPPLLHDVAIVLLDSGCCWFELTALFLSRKCNRMLKCCVLVNW